jgi:hypothetical protein
MRPRVCIYTQRLSILPIQQPIIIVYNLHNYTNLGFSFHPSHLPVLTLLQDLWGVAMLPLLHLLNPARIYKN